MKTNNCDYRTKIIVMHARRIYHIGSIFNIWIHFKCLCNIIKNLFLYTFSFIMEYIVYHCIVCWFFNFISLSKIMYSMACFILLFLLFCPSLQNSRHLFIFYKDIVEFIFTFSSLVFNSDSILAFVLMPLLSAFSFLWSFHIICNSNGSSQ